MFWAYFMGLLIPIKDWGDLTQVDEPTYKTAKQIEELSKGLSPKQFTDAISIAISFVSSYSTLLCSRSQLDRQKDGQD